MRGSSSSSLHSKAGTARTGGRPGTPCSKGQAAASLNTAHAAQPGAARRLSPPIMPLSDSQSSSAISLWTARGVSAVEQRVLGAGQAGPFTRSHKGVAGLGAPKATAHAEKHAKWSKDSTQHDAIRYLSRRHPWPLPASPPPQTRFPPGCAPGPCKAGCGRSGASCCQAATAPTQHLMQGMRGLRTPAAPGAWSGLPAWPLGCAARILTLRCAPLAHAVTPCSQPPSQLSSRACHQS